MLFLIHIFPGEPVPEGDQDLESCCGSLIFTQKIARIHTT